MNILKNRIVRGMLILTAASYITRISGFFIRIFLISKIGAEGMGIYQLIFPVQIICYAISCSGIETAISKLTASEKSRGNYLYSGFIISFVLSLLLSALLIIYNKYICQNILLEPRCSSLIYYLAAIVPLTSIHSCICSFFIGNKSTKITSVSLIIEQLTRIVAIILSILFLEYNSIFPGPECAIFGSLCGEIAACAFCIFKLYRTGNYSFLTIKLSEIRRVIKLSVPVSLNRLMLSILQSIQNILIPSLLIVYGLSSKESLSIYGIILGLVIPFILFPGALINSYSLLLLPEISSADSNGNIKKIRLLTKKSIWFCVIFGLICSLIFIIFGEYIGIYLLHNSLAGEYINKLGIICPFIYLNQTMSSIINGLGKTSVTFGAGIFTVLLEIFIIIKIMPAIGIAGYIISFLICNFINSLILLSYTTRKIFNQHF